MNEEYQRAKRLGERAYRKAVVEGQYPYLPALEEFFRDGSSDIGVPIGVMEIPLAQVVGTKTRGRQAAFACNFMPLLDTESEFALKWTNLYNAHLSEGIRDAVKVYEYMWKFYVLEGNKRVSVLKFVDMPVILADITRVMPKHTEEKDVRIYLEFDRFFKVCPMYDLIFSEEGCYERLAEFLEEDLETPWPVEKIQSLSVAFSRFSEVFDARLGARMEMSASDAFLVYLGFYRYEDPLEAPKDLLTKRIEKLKGEFLAESGGRPVTFREDPTQETPSAFGAFMKWAKLYNEKNPLKIAFLYEVSPEKSSWIYGHELGRNGLEEAYPHVVETLTYEGCLEQADIREAIDDAVEKGAQLVFTTSPPQMEETMRAAVHFPQVRFMNCSINLSATAVRTYYGRMHEAKFLMGVLAATVAKNHKIGYVADYPIYGAVSRVNAFAIGAGLADPEAQVYLTWTSLKDHDWKEYLIQQGARVISGPDLIKPSQASRDYGLYSIEEDGSAKSLAMPVWDWGKTYQLIVQSILDGSFDREDSPKDGQALNYWWGMSAGVIDVILSQNLSYYSEKMIDIYRKALINGTFRPFDGELRSQEGVVHQASDPGLTSEEIVSMDWLNDNVIGRIPEPSELTDVGKTAVKTSGVGPAAGKL